MAAYQNSPLYHEFEQKKAGQGHSSKLPGQPKRPTTPFMIFATQVRLPGPGPRWSCGCF